MNKSLRLPFILALGWGVIGCGGKSVSVAPPSISFPGFPGKIPGNNGSIAPHYHVYLLGGLGDKARNPVAINSKLQVIGYVGQSGTRASEFQNYLLDPSNGRFV